MDNLPEDKHIGSLLSLKVFFPDSTDTLLDLLYLTLSYSLRFIKIRGRVNIMYLFTFQDAFVRGTARL